MVTIVLLARLLPATGRRSIGAGQIFSVRLVHILSSVLSDPLSRSPLIGLLSHYTPRRRLGGEEVYLLLILDLGTRYR
jgi:hypothetical protein